VVVTVESIVVGETVVVVKNKLVVEAGRVLVIVVREPDMVVVTVIVLSGNVLMLVEIEVKVVEVIIVDCEWSEPVVKKNRKTYQLGSSCWY